MVEKWRGIKTTQKRINEKNPVTIVNRLGQKSLSLPRIDDKKRWAGYPSLAGTARKIAKLIPKCKYYIEPFAGTAKVFQMLEKNHPNKYEYTILSDTSKFIYKWLNKEMNLNTIILNMDFKNTVEYWNKHNSVFLLDPPWNKSYYAQSFSSFNRKSVKDYDLEVLELCRKIKGKFIITTRKENTRMLNSEFNNYLIESEYILCGKFPKVMLTTNIKYRKLEMVKS